MKWQEFQSKTNNMPAIDSEAILTGTTKISHARVQLSRWVKSGKLIQLKRGVYLLSEPYRKIDINEYYIASILVKPSYISLEKAFEYHGLIPEAVNVYTSVTTKRPENIKSNIGIFDYRHIKPSLFWGYESAVIQGQPSYIALPEKAILDYFYLKHEHITSEYLAEMRLQHVSRINIERLSMFASRYKKPGILRIAEIVTKYISVYKKREINP